MTTLQLKNEWLELSLPYCDRETAETLFADLLARYSEKHRFYHTLSHISELLNLAAKHKKSLENYDAVRFSIWYHDAIYNPKSKTNEADSAVLAKEKLSTLKIGIENIRTIVRYIEATAGHKVDSQENDLLFFLDFDLAALAADREKYRTDIQNIRKEYSIYPTLLYKQGRKKVLKHFLAMEFIFNTLFFREHFEEKARDNICSELGT